MSNIRDADIGQAVVRKSIADVGDLWGTANEEVPVACATGACGLTTVAVSRVARQSADGRLG